MRPWGFDIGYLQVWDIVFAYVGGGSPQCRQTFSGEEKKWKIYEQSGWVGGGVAIEARGLG